MHCGPYAGDTCALAPRRRCSTVHGGLHAVTRVPRRGASHTLYATVSFLIFDLASFSVILDSRVSLTRSSGHTVLL